MLTEQIFIVAFGFRETIDPGIMRIIEAMTTNSTILLRSKTMAMIACSSNGTAANLYEAFAAAGLKGLIELTIIEAGTDWCASRDKTYAGWLTHHLGNPRAF